jgi:hypothetical protein
LYTALEELKKEIKESNNKKWLEKN